MKSTVVICTFLALVCFSRALSFPDGIKKCKIDNDGCIIKVTNELVKKGISEYGKLGLVSVDPLLIKKMDIEQGGNSSVTINLKFRNVHLVGISKANIYRVAGFKEDPDKNKLEIRFKAPLGTVQGPYQISGRMLVLPIEGKGNVTLNLENLDVVMKFLTKKIVKDGKAYMHIEKSKFNYEVTGANVNFSNLFNGDKALGDNMNLFLNANWKILLDELHNPISKSFSVVFKDLLNLVFDNIPYDEFFEK